MNELERGVWGGKIGEGERKGKRGESVREGKERRGGRKGGKAAGDVGGCWEAQMATAEVPSLALGYLVHPHI